MSQEPAARPDWTGQKISPATSRRLFAHHVGTTTGSHTRSEHRPPASLLSQLAWAVVFAAIAAGIGMGFWAIWS